MGAAEQTNQIQWAAISLTHVEYPKDFIGFVLAIISLTPICILVGFGTLILFRRDLHTISYLIGLLLNEVVNWILKHLIQEYRPLRQRETVFSEYGMPSSHAQFMWFYAVYLSFFLIIRMHRNYHFVDELWKYAIGLVVYGLACTVGYSRIYLGYHSFSQVAVGALIGLTLGTIWFSTVHLVLTPFFPVLASCSLGEFLMLRDSTLIPNVMWFEYTCSRSESRSRQRKITSRKSQ
ncbi:dolichyldiphosphatase 1-like isoform X2 [Tubulanus polymorphus]|uniref:dolichyldiphosphatase 1-like isoform X2 n=1 Tax=Tubulanus polymorphus TaxID=672921 RepID=UPI003DA1EB25